MSVFLHRYFILLTSFEISIVFGQELNLNKTEVLDIRLSYVRVPAVNTYYVCQQFKVKDDQPYHVIRFEPVLNNTDIIHHMLLFGCTFEMDEKGPHPCDSLDYRCRTWLVKWDRGMTEDIVMPENGGVRIGKDSFKYILLQVHWNNEGALNNQTDSSGMRLHVTTILRQYDIGNVQIGQNDITIPRDSDKVFISGTCSRRCTGLMLPMPVYITDVYLHMHGLGVKSAIDIHRDREVSERIVSEDNYNYTNPIWHRLDPPAIIYPGEPVEVKCWFDSSSTGRFRNYTTHFGQGSAAEMCYAFIRYYPRILGFDQCIQKGNKNEIPHAICLSVSRRKHMIQVTWSPKLRNVHSPLSRRLYNRSVEGSHLNRSPKCERATVIGVKCIASKGKRK